MEKEVKRNIAAYLATLIYFLASLSFFWEGYYIFAIVTLFCAVGAYLKKKLLLDFLLFFLFITTLIVCTGDLTPYAQMDNINMQRSRFDILFIIIPCITFFVYGYFWESYRKIKLNKRQLILIIVFVLLATILAILAH